VFNVSAIGAGHYIKFTVPPAALYCDDSDHIVLFAATVYTPVVFYATIYR